MKFIFKFKIHIFINKKKLIKIQRKDFTTRFVKLSKYILPNNIAKNIYNDIKNIRIKSLI